MGWFSDRAAPRPLGAARHERGLVRPPVRPLVALAMMFTVFASGLHCAQAMAAEVSAVRLWRAPDHTRVVLDVSEQVSFTRLKLENPERFVVDLKNSRLTSSLAVLSLEGTPISQLRSGIREGTDLRLVVDLKSKVKTSVFLLPPNEVNGYRVVIDLFDPPSSQSDPEPVLSVDSLDARRDIIVAIDAGHGGEDPGASGPGKLREKTVVLQIARRLEQQLSGVPGFKPVLIRSGDYYVSLKSRRNKARELQADLLVSIHADAFRQTSAHGASVYALSTRGATSTAAKYLAENENAADLVGGVEVAEMDPVLASVLTDLSMTGTLDTSLNLGALILEQIGGVARLHKKQVEQAGFAVLKSPDVPSLLIETGFISNPTESERLSTPAYQDKMARAIRRGIQSWFARQPPPGTLLAWQREQGGREVTVAPGDTLSEIAQQHSVSVASIKTTNGLNRDVIFVGQTLLIPDA
ncbi:N-acetylmuramoyl-L-alanine amidase [Luminiphilus sp.]|nr:N-acetylmuramoyl-L-alanine amidase [Luminiphilus sp.]